MTSWDNDQTRARPLHRMQRGARITLGVLLAIAGIFVALFFAGIFLIADCAQQCRERGEHAPIFVAIGGGLGVAVGGLMWRSAGLRAAGAMLTVGGAIDTVGQAWVIAYEHATTLVVWICLAVGVGCLAVGLFLLRRWRE